MKVKDMERAMRDDATVVVIEGTKYAGWKLPPFTRGKSRSTMARRAKIVALRQPRRVFSGTRADFGGYRAHDGVGILFHDDDTTATVKPTDVYGTLAEYERDYDEQQNQKRREEDAERRLAERLKRVQKITPSAQFNYVVNYGTGSGRYSRTHVTVRLTELEALL